MLVKRITNTFESNKHITTIDIVEMFITLKYLYEMVP